MKKSVVRYQVILVLKTFDQVLQFKQGNTKLDRQ